MSGKKGKNKILASFKFHKKFKDEIDVAAELEGISTTALIEREVGRYLRVLKRVASENKRIQEIKKDHGGNKS
jgi:hypothetical protein